MYDFSGDFETFFTGETDITKSGLYDTFRGSTDLQQWEGKHCSNIQDASDGTKFKSFIKENETLLFFRKSMCRPQRLVSTRLYSINHLSFAFIQLITCTNRKTNSTRPSLSLFLDRRDFRRFLKRKHTRSPGRVT